jgi:hypothetical protein
MILSAHQPAYLPWLGYFDKIARSDVFVYLDTVQYEKNSFINRNRIKGPNGPMWLTIPVKTKGHMEGSLRTTEIDDAQPWRAKHAKSIEMNYRRAPDFAASFAQIEPLINLPESNLAEYCFQQLQFWCEELRLRTRIVRSSELALSSAKSDLVLDLCRHFGADHYLSGALGRNYLQDADFEAENIRIEYQDYKSPSYSQLWGEFVPNLAVLDAWMNKAAVAGA